MTWRARASKLLHCTRRLRSPERIGQSHASRLESAVGCYGFNTRCPASMPPSVVAWVRGYVGTRLVEFSRLGDLGARCVGTWVRGYTTFQTFLAGRSGRAVREYVGTWVQGFQNYLGHVLVGSSRWRWVGGYKDFETPRGVGGERPSPWRWVRRYVPLKTYWGPGSGGRVA